jgi:hypothetical protein
MPQSTTDENSCDVLLACVGAGSNKVKGWLSITPEEKRQPRFLHHHVVRTLFTITSVFLLLQYFFIDQYREDAKSAFETYNTENYEHIPPAGEFGTLIASLILVGISLIHQLFWGPKNLSATLFSFSGHVNLWVNLTVCGVDIYELVRGTGQNPVDVLPTWPRFAIPLIGLCACVTILAVVFPKRFNKFMSEKT